MSGSHGRTIAISSLEQFDALVAAGARRMRGWRIQDVDLTDRAETLRRLDPAGALLLGCSLTEQAEDSLRDRGALVFPDIPELPFDPYRSLLYTPDELYAGLTEATYSETPDARIYAWSRQRNRAQTSTLGRALHDSSIDVALDAELAGKRAVGVMGGHALARDTAQYGHAAELGRTLARAGLHVATGGGPGAMEAANLGAYLAGAEQSVVEEALDLLRPAPTFQASIEAWARAAFAVRRRWPDGGSSLGIPTWFYGHEPPNPFASGIAKYFQNSLREDTLLRHCNAGIVFLPGAAGTVQEIFQDACENYYADEATVAPMVLVGVRHWTEEVPAWALLKRLATGRPMEQAISLVNDVDEVAALLS